ARCRRSRFETLCTNVHGDQRNHSSFPTRRSSDLGKAGGTLAAAVTAAAILGATAGAHAQSVAAVPENAARPDPQIAVGLDVFTRSEEHTSELQSRENLVCRLLLEKKKTTDRINV